MSTSTSSDMPTTHRRKLIEVALPLEDINRESARENYIYKGNPSAIHKWWAQRPLAACRAVLFGQMVDDPSSLPEEFPTVAAQETERERLFDIIRDMVVWENMTNGTVLHRALVEIARSAARNHGVALPKNMSPAGVADALKRYAPPVLDPFAGGGSIPLEAQRLGLEAHASDLNPVAVLINKALIEIPAKFAGRPPVNPESRKRYLHKEWKGAEGLAEDVRHYGRWMREEAFKRISHLYPKVTLPREQGGGEATVIAWLWARTVRCPNPACGAQMPLARSLALSTKKGKQAWVDPHVDRATMPPTITFSVRYGSGGPPEAPKIGRGARFRCIACGNIAPEKHIKDEALAGRMGAQMMAIVAEGKGGRVYLPPTEDQDHAARSARPNWKPEGQLALNPRHMVPPLYGMKTVGDLFTHRQLVALTTFSDSVIEARERVLTCTEGDEAYADAVSTYLAFALDKTAEYNCTLVPWDSKDDRPKGVFARQAIPMVWDYAEVNPLAEIGGTLNASIRIIADAIMGCASASGIGFVDQLDAMKCLPATCSFVVCTDPPYYDNVPYADLSDFFYVWLRRALKSIYPALFNLLLVSKAQELIAEPVRHGGKENAERFFEEGLAQAFACTREVQSAGYPMSVFYAFKQTESVGNDGDNGNGIILSASTGWETMLEGLLGAQFAVLGTWPMRTERQGRARSLESNALASSIVLVCRPRPADAPITTRRDFLAALKRDLSPALKMLQHGKIAPVDLAQASIGPGMAVFSRYSRVLESDGSPMRVRTALQLINQTLDETLAEQEGEYDAETRWAVAWFEQYGMEDGPYGVAETLSKAKNTAIGGLVEAGVLRAQGGKVRLLRRDELADGWNPAAAKRHIVWEVTQRLIRALQDEGEQGAAAILDHVGGLGDIARDLAYRLYTVCERKKWADEALAYNSLVVEWTGINGAERPNPAGPNQPSLF